MSFRNKGLVFAMESEEVVDAPVEEMVPESQAEVETASAEVTEQVGEIESMDGAVVDAEADAGTLGDIQEVMADSVESGEGLTEEAAQIAEVAVESIRARLGMKRDQKVMPAMESFGSKSSRLAATKIAMEGVMETIKSIWANIVKAVKWVWEKIKSFFLALTKNRAALLKHLEGLQGRVKSFTGEVGKTITGGAVKAFSIDGKCSAATADKVLSDSEKLFKAITVGANNAAGLVNKLTDVKATSVELDKAGTDLLDQLKEAIAPLGTVASVKGATDGMIVAHFGNLAHGKSVAIASDKEGKTKSVSVQLEDNQKEAAKEGAALSKGEMEKVLGSAIALVKSLQSFDKVEKDLERITKACEGVSQAVLKGVVNQAGDNKEVAESLKTAAANIRSLNSMTAKFGASLPSAIFNAAKSAGDYVVASLASTAKKEEKKPEEKK